MRKVVAMMLVVIWPAVTSHAFLESLGVIHVAHHEAVDAAQGDHHHCKHGGEGHAHHYHHHPEDDSEGDAPHEHGDDHHVFADGDYAWTGGGKTLTKPVREVCSSFAFLWACSLNQAEVEPDGERPQGPAPPGTAPPLLQKTWQFSLRAAISVRAPSIFS